MAEENNNTNNNDNTDLEFNDFLNKFKETDNFKNYVNEALTKEHSGLLKNRDDVLKEKADLVNQLKELNNFKSKTSEDEVVKLITSGIPEDRQKAIEMLNGEITTKFQKLLDEKDTELLGYKEKEQAYIQEKEKEQVLTEFKKLKVFESVREEAIKDFVMPNIYANFKIKENKLTYIGTEINKSGKPLTLEEYLVGFLKERTFFLKDKTGSGLYSKTTENNSATQSKSSYEDRMRNKGKIKD